MGVAAMRQLEPKQTSRSTITECRIVPCMRHLSQAAFYSINWKGFDVRYDSGSALPDFV